MDFDVPHGIRDLLDELDAFIEQEIKPLEDEDDNTRFFDHRREYARTDFEGGGVPRADWYALLGEMRRRADAAGYLRCAEGPRWCEKMLTGEMRMAFGLTEPDHGSDATWLETTAERDGDEWVIKRTKRFNTGLDVATHDMVFGRTSGQPGEANGITCFVVPTDTPGFNVGFMWWTFNMPTEHAELTLEDIPVTDADILGS